jgi:hypothetical protein
MRTLELARLGSAGDLFDSVSSRRRPATRARLAVVRPEVLSAYGAYEDRPADVTALAPVVANTGTRTALRTNYDALLRTHRDVRDAILDAAPMGICPLCGGREATTLDHYLPRTSHPEFAVLPLNLVPCCRECNVNKLDRVRENGCAIYLHLYIDALDDTQRILFADVEIDAGVPAVEFSVRPPASMAAGLAERVETHFRYLRLACYYEKKAIEEAGVQVQSIDAQLDAAVPVADIQASLKREATYVSRLHGVNHWRFAALVAFASSLEFCSGACSDWLPV